MPTRRVVAEGSTRPVDRLVRRHHTARVAIVMGTHTDAPMLELTEDGYGTWALVTRRHGRRDATEIATGHIGHEDDET